jgi:hypothetical protein
MLLVADHDCHEYPMLRAWAHKVGRTAFWIQPVNQLSISHRRSDVPPYLSEFLQLGMSGQASPITGMRETQLRTLIKCSLTLKRGAGAFETVGTIGVALECACTVQAGGHSEYCTVQDLLSQSVDRT